MKKTTLLLALITTVLQSCVTVDKVNRLAERETNSFELKQLSNSEENSKISCGMFIFGFGSSQYKEVQTKYITVVALVDCYFRTIKIPIEKLRVKIDNCRIRPTLKIKYIGRKKTDTDVLNKNYATEYILTCHSDYLPEDFNKITVK